MLSGDDEKVASAIAGLVDAAVPASAVTAISGISAGNNNRVYRVDTTSGPFLAKQYFSHVGDQRDRLASEFLFASYANQVAPQYAPRAIEKDVAAGVAIYEYVEAVRLAPGEIGQAEVKEAIAFFRALNQSAERSKAAGLPMASEVAFSLSDHAKIIDRRLAQFDAIEIREDIDREAVRFITGLRDKWSDVDDGLGQYAGQAQALPDLQRCVSPSDFGFHNALRRPDGRLCFVDFEYAGWDDPARMIGDFFAQPALPVPEQYFDLFTEQCLAVFPDAAVLRQRVLILRPVYVIKWCCIAMGVFLPVNMARRKFANPKIDERELKLRQLKTARLLFDKLGLS